MRTLRFSLRLLTVVLAVTFAVSLSGTAFACSGSLPKACNGGCIGPDDTCLLEPVPGGVSYISASASAGLGGLYQYINGGMWNLIFGMGVAVAVLNGAAGGLMIVLSNGDSNMIGKGKTRFLWSGVGLIMLLLSGVILQFINPLGFLNV